MRHRSELCRCGSDPEAVRDGQRGATTAVVSIDHAVLDRRRPAGGARSAPCESCGGAAGEPGRNDAIAEGSREALHSAGAARVPRPGLGACVTEAAASSSKTPGRQAGRATCDNPVSMDANGSPRHGAPRRVLRSESERQAILLACGCKAKGRAKHTARSVSHGRHLRSMATEAAPAGRATHLVIDRRSFSRMSRLYSSCARQERNAELKLRFAMCRMTRAIT